MPTGKAFEYACLQELRHMLAEHDIHIVENQSLIVARNSFREESDATREEMVLAARAGFRTILRYEPQLTNPIGTAPLILSIQEDAQGIAGDVRDLLCIRQQNNWEIGISCKHNHDAVKHPRLSQTIDFGSKWFGRRCSKQYFDEILPIYNWLRTLREQRVKWEDVEEIQSRVYRPVLFAFLNELRRLYDEYGGVVPNGLVAYLIGRHDFYKLIDRVKRRYTSIQAFNMFGTLNLNSGRNRVNNLPRTKLPQRIFSIDFVPQSDNEVLIVCDNGWSLSLRIHSASKKVEPSLKFDVKLGGVPPELFSHDEPWEL